MTAECVCCAGQLYFYLQSEGCLTLTNTNQQSIIDVSTTPLVCLAKVNKHPLYTRSKRKQTAKAAALLLRNKVIIGPLPPPYNNSTVAQQEVKKWKDGSRGLLSRMMWGVQLARKLQCTTCYIDEVDLPIIQFILARSSSSSSPSNGTTYSALLRQYGQYPSTLTSQYSSEPAKSESVESHQELLEVE